MKTGAKGLEVIKHFESLELKAYQDSAGVWTIGYGHTGSAASKGNTITEAEAEALLRGDLDDAETDVGRFIDADLKQWEFDALVSFTFNVGGGALSKSTLRRKLNAGDRPGAAEEFLRWNKATVGGKKVELAGLTRRRRSERHLFLTDEVKFFEKGGIVDPDATDGAPPTAISAASAGPASGGGDYLSDFAAAVESWGLRHFRPTELLALGASHASPGSPAFGRNSRPPRDMWDNIRPTITALDQLRHVLGAPVNILSAYRNEDYNRLVAGAADSQHMSFRAIDFYAKSLSGPSHWASALADIRSSGVFSGAILTYDTFVHIDCRGTDIGP